MVPVAICVFLVIDKHDHVIHRKKVPIGTLDYFILEFLTTFELGQLFEVERFVIVNGEV